MDNDLRQGQSEREFRSRTEVEQLQDRIKVLEKDYSELIMAVNNKYPDESRHETALKYIQKAETSSEPPKQHKGDNR